MGDTYILRKGNATLADIQGGPAAGSLFSFGNGTFYYVDPANGNDNNSGLRPDEAFAGLEAGEDACTANKHDTVVYLAGSSGNNLAAALTWDKNYTHLIGVAAPTETAQRARIFQTSTVTGASPLLNITATGCYFGNFYIFQGVNDATSLINVQVTGGRNYFENVHFAGGGHAAQAIDGGASLKLNGAEENTFVNCTIGVDTIDAATGMMGILFDGEAHRNVFRDCVVRMRAGNGGAGFVEVADLTGIDRDNTFIDCLFLNNSGTDMTSGFVIPAGMGAPRKLLLKDCMILGTAKLDANDRGVLFGNMNAVTGADTSGEAVELIT
jgi:hypothetical protein